MNTEANNFLSRAEKGGTVAKPGLKPLECLIRKYCIECRQKLLSLPEDCSSILNKPGSKHAGASLFQLKSLQKILTDADADESGIAGTGGKGESGLKLERDLARIQAAWSSLEFEKPLICLLSISSCALVDDMRCKTKEKIHK